jgi:hypothetical protein
MSERFTPFSRAVGGAGAAGLEGVLRLVLDELVEESLHLGLRDFAVLRLGLLLQVGDGLGVVVAEVLPPRLVQDCGLRGAEGMALGVDIASHEARDAADSEIGSTVGHLMLL